MISGRSWFSGLMCSRTDGCDDDDDDDTVDDKAVGEDTVELERTVDFCFGCSAAFLALLLLPKRDESENALLPAPAPAVPVPLSSFIWREPEPLKLLEITLTLLFLVLVLVLELELTSGRPKDLRGVKEYASTVVVVLQRDRDTANSTADAVWNFIFFGC